MTQPSRLVYKLQHGDADRVAFEVGHALRRYGDAFESSRVVVARNEAHERRLYANGAICVADEVATCIAKMIEQLDESGLMRLTRVSDDDGGGSWRAVGAIGHDGLAESDVVGDVLYVRPSDEQWAALMMQPGATCLTVRTGNSSSTPPRTRTPLWHTADIAPTVVFAAASFVVLESDAPLSPCCNAPIRLLAVRNSAHIRRLCTDCRDPLPPIEYAVRVDERASQPGVCFQALHRLNDNVPFEPRVLVDVPLASLFNPSNTDLLFRLLEDERVSALLMPKIAVEEVAVVAEEEEEEEEKKVAEEAAEAAEEEEEEGEETEDDGGEEDETDSPVQIYLTADIEQLVPLIDGVVLALVVTHRTTHTSWWKGKLDRETDFRIGLYRNEPNLVGCTKKHAAWITTINSLLNLSPNIRYRRIIVDSADTVFATLFGGDSTLKEKRAPVLRRLGEILRGVRSVHLLTHGGADAIGFAHLFAAYVKTLRPDALVSQLPRTARKADVRVVGGYNELVAVAKKPDYKRVVWFTSANAATDKNRYALARLVQEVGGVAPTVHDATEVIAADPRRWLELRDVRVLVLPASCGVRVEHAHFDVMLVDCSRHCSALAFLLQAMSAITNVPRIYVNPDYGRAKARLPALQRTIGNALKAPLFTAIVDAAHIESLNYSKVVFEQWRRDNVSRV